MGNSFKVEIVFKVTHAETGDDFFESKHTWATMSLSSVTGIERAMHEAQDKLISWSENEVQ